MRNYHSFLFHAFLLSLGFFQPVLAEDPQPVILRGWVELNGKVSFSLQRVNGGGSAWVGLNQKYSGGQIVEFNREERSILYKDASGAHLIKMPEQFSFQSSIVFDQNLDYASAQDGELKSFDSVPEGVKKLPAQALVSYLKDGGYEIPYHLITKARSDKINEVIREKDDSRAHAAQARGRQYTGPRAPTYTTSMTREEKIKRGIVGYTNL